MMRECLGLLVDIALGVVLAGVAAPLVISILPGPYRGPVALGLLALASVAIVGGCRRALGLGTARDTRERA